MYNTFVKPIDAILNRFTMYRVVLYGLIGVLIIAVVLAAVGVLGVSALGLLGTTTILIGGCYAANKVLSWTFRAPTNSESWLISALILACILPQVDSVGDAGLVLLCAVIAMASKFVLRFHGSHIFNPVAAGAAVMSATGLMAVTWWIATPYMAPFTAILALVILRKIRNFRLFFAFAAAAITTMIYVGLSLQDQPLSEILELAIVSWPIIFMGSVMITEPSTMPPTRFYQLLFASLVGVLFASQLQVGSFSMSPEVALVAGNLFTLAVAPSYGALVRLREVQTLAPNIYGLTFDKPRNLRFMPGQYLEWTLPHQKADSRGNRRLFSIASSPTEDVLRIGVKTYQPSSSYKQALVTLKPGAFIRLAHVAGSFTLPASVHQPIVCIAGGIGVTPFRSMLQHMIDTKTERDVTLYYTAAHQEDFVYVDVIESAKRYGLQPNLIVGPLQPDHLSARAEQLRQSTVYISGPDAFVTHCKQMLIELGVPRRSIHTDHFTGY